MSIPTEKNTSVKVTERLSKYKDLEIEVQRMCVCVCVCGGGGGGGGDESNNNSGIDREPGTY